MAREATADAAEVVHCWRCMRTPVSEPGLVCRYCRRNQMRSWDRVQRTATDERTHEKHRGADYDRYLRWEDTGMGLPAVGQRHIRRTPNITFEWGPVTTYRMEDDERRSDGH